MKMRATQAANRSLLQFGLFMAGLYALLFGLPAVFKDNGLPAVAALAATVVAGVFAVRPGWNLIPRRVDAGTLLVLAGILASAVLAAMGLVLLGIATPYDKLQLNLLAVMPLMLAITGIEELLFRQLAYRWLEQRQVPGRAIMLATAVAWAGGHAGGALTPGYTMLFVLLQSLFLIWIGVLLGKLRRRSGSWPVAWLAHLAYNASFLYVSGLIR